MKGPTCLAVKLSCDVELDWPTYSCSSAACKWCVGSSVSGSHIDHSWWWCQHLSVVGFDFCGETWPSLQITPSPTSTSLNLMRTWSKQLYSISESTVNWIRGHRIICKCWNAERAVYQRANNNDQESDRLMEPTFVASHGLLSRGSATRAMRRKNFCTNSGIRWRPVTRQQSIVMSVSWSCDVAIQRQHDAINFCYIKHVRPDLNKWNCEQALEPLDWVRGQLK